METIELFILKQIAGEIQYSPASSCFRMECRTVTDTIRQIICKEGKKWGLNKTQVCEKIHYICNNIQSYYNHKEQSLQCVQISKELKVGDRLVVSCEEKGSGKVAISLLYCGDSQFVVLSSTHFSLRKWDVVNSYNSDYLSIDNCAYLTVYRGGERFPDNKKVFRIPQIVHLKRIMPSIIQQVIDSRRSFTFEEDSSINSDNQSIDATWNSMTIFMHSFSDKMLAYVDFLDDENQESIAKFSMNEDCLNTRAEEQYSLFVNVFDTQMDPQTLKDGKLFYSEENKQFVVLEKAAMQIHR